ncbi:MAG: glycosyltransferase family 87 protein [Bacteroidota bacterium]
MIFDKSTLKSFWKFSVFTGVVIVTIFVFENINGRFWLNDFKVYYLAAKALLTGQQVYEIPFGLSSGFYKYSPSTLFFIFPYCLVPFEIARIVHFFILALIIISVFFVIRDVIKNYLFDFELQSENLLMSFAFICVLIHFVKELHLGNINVALLLLLCLSLYAILKSRFILAGILFALVVLTKPFFLILLLPMIFRKKWKTLVSLGVTMILAGLIPALFFGFSKNILLHTEWVRTMFEHNANYPGHNGIQYLIQFYINPNVPNAFQYLIIAGGGLFYLVLHYFNRSFEKKNGNTERVMKAGLVMEWYLLIAILPNLVKTDSEHFLCSLPLIMLIIYYLSVNRQIILISLFVILIFFYGANSTDLLGAELSDKLFSMGLIGISNLFIISLAVIFYYKDIRQWLIKIPPNFSS